MSRRFGQGGTCVSLGQWGLARRLCGHGVGAEMGARVPRLGRGWMRVLVEKGYQA